MISATGFPETDAATPSKTQKLEIDKTPQPANQHKRGARKTSAPSKMPAAKTSDSPVTGEKYKHRSQPALAEIAQKPAQPPKSPNPAEHRLDEHLANSDHSNTMIEVTNYLPSSAPVFPV
jgi:hypothetical protein